MRQRSFLSGLNLNFSLFKIGYLNIAKESSLHYNLLIAEDRTGEYLLFSREFAKRKQPIPGFEFESAIAFLTLITDTLSTPTFLKESRKIKIMKVFSEYIGN